MSASFNTNNQLQQALTAIRVGQTAEARTLLVQVVKTNRQNTQAWFLLSYVVETTTQRIECLQRALAIQPDYQPAQNRLSKLKNNTKAKLKLPPPNIQPPIANSQVSLDLLIEQWLANLTYTEQTVLKHLYLNPQRFSVGAIGRIISASSERVQDLQQRAFTKLKEPTIYAIIQPFVTHLFTLLQRAGKSIGEADLETTLQQEFTVEKIDLLGVVRLVLALERENKIPTNPLPALIETPTSKLSTQVIDASQHDAQKELTLSPAKPLESAKSQPLTPQERLLLQAVTAPIVDLGLSRRTYNAVYRAGIHTIGDLASLLPEKILQAKNVGETSLAEIETRLGVYLVENPEIAQQETDQPVQSTISDESVPPQPLSPFVSDNIQLTVLDLSPRSYNALMRAGVSTIGRLVALSDEEIGRVNNVGTKAINEIREKLAVYLANSPQLVQPEIPEEKRSTSAVSLELLDRTLGIPLDDISIERLGLSQLLNAGLKRQGISSIQQLVHQASDLTNDGQIGEPLKRYLSWLVEQDETVWANEIAGKGMIPLDRMALANTSVEDMVAQWLYPLDERGLKVIKWRFGLRGEMLTLEEVGERLNVTRERIRQIEKKALRILENRYRQWGKGILQPFLSFLCHNFIEYGGLLSEPEMITLLENNKVIRLGHIDPIGVFLLICELDERFCYYKRSQIVALTSYPVEVINKVQAYFATILTERLSAIPGTVLLDEFKQSDVYQKLHSEFTDNFFSACLRVHPEIEQVDFNLYFLAKWSKKRLGAIVTAMRELGQPAHYTVIAEKANALLPPDQHFTARAIHARLGQYPDLFIWVRLRGMYGLKEWGLEQSLSYMDAIAHILETVGHPLTLGQVLERLPEIRPYFDHSSVIITLGTHPRFRPFPGNAYGLAEWTNSPNKASFDELFGTQLARWQAEFDHPHQKGSLDTQNEVDTIRAVGLDFFKG